jgi:hypothetical protein
MVERFDRANQNSHQQRMARANPARVRRNRTKPCRVISRFSSDVTIRQVINLEKGRLAMAGSTGSRVRSSVLIAMLVAFGAFLISKPQAQQSAPSQTSDGQSQESTGSAAQTAKAPEATSKPATTGAGIPALVVDSDQMLGILGKQVRSSAGEDMGRIVDVIIDKSARVRAAVIDFGGFLGVGNRQIAVAWSAIRLPSQDKPGALVVDFTRDQLRVAPTYKAGEQVVLLGQADAAATPSNATDKDAMPKEPATK